MFWFRCCKYLLSCDFQWTDILSVACAVDAAADGTKQRCTPEKTKDKEKAGEKEGVNKADEGPSAEVKEEDSKDGAEVRKETPNAMETAADSKAPGDKYSPKVSLRMSVMF